MVSAEYGQKAKIAVDNNFVAYYIAHMAKRGYL
jgi:hypothetical protein